MFKQKEIIKYVPVPSFGAYNDLWQNKGYLQETASVTNSRVWYVEVTEALRMVREKADSAETPEELKGCNYAISIIKKMLLLHTAAKNRISDIEYKEQLNKEAEKTIN